MARIRSLKPMFFQHDGLSALDAETHILAAGLLCYADDYGYFNANPKLIEAFVFPLRNLSVTVPEMLGSLSRIGYMELGKGADGRTYGHIVNFDKHQRVHNPSASVIKELEIDWQITEKFGNDSRENPLGIRNKEGNKEEERITPPTPSKEGEPKEATPAPKRRRTRTEVLAPYPKEVSDIVNGLVEKWPAQQPGDGKPITADIPKLAERIDLLLKEPNVTRAVLEQSAEMYLSEQKRFYKHPQFFFGIGNGESAHWLTYARMVVHQQSREATQ